MQQTNDAYILTDFQLQFLLMGIKCSSLYGLPQNKFNGNFEELYYQIYDLAVRQILKSSEYAFEICEPLKSWLLAVADADVVLHIMASGRPPRAFCAYLSEKKVVVMERYVYQKFSIRMSGYQKVDFYEEIRKILESCGIQEPNEPLPKEMITDELADLRQHLRKEYQKKNYEMPEKFCVEISSLAGVCKKRISVIRYCLENYLVAEEGQTLDLFFFEMSKLAELLENT